MRYFTRHGESNPSITAYNDGFQFTIIKIILYLHCPSPVSGGGNFLTAMKHCLTILIASLALFVSCEQLAQLQEGLTLDDDSVALVSQTVPASATSAKSISFKSPDVWVAEVKDGASWLSVSPAYGGAGNYTLEFTLEENLVTEPRTGKVVLTCRSKTVDIVITQEAAPELTVADGAQLTQTVDYLATTAQSVSFVAPYSWTASVKDASWLEVSPSSGDAGNITIQFAMEQNWTYESRTGKVEIECNGKKVEVSITQTGAPEWAAPTTTRYVKTISMQYKENVQANARIHCNFSKLAYDSKNRVVSVTDDSGDIQTFDYSHSGKILFKAGDNTETATLGADGLVDQFSVTEDRGSGNIQLFSYTFKRSGGYISKVISRNESGGNEVEMSLAYTEGKLISVVLPEERADLTYKFNYALPAINVDLNAYMFASGGQYVSPMWLGYCGKLGDYLMEYPMFSYATSGPSSGLPDLSGVSNIVVQRDSDGYFTTITYYLDVVYKSTQEKVGTNEVIYTITYID